jgi:hypothetical protein
VARISVPLEEEPHGADDLVAEVDELVNDLGGDEGVSAVMSVLGILDEGKRSLCAGA